MRTGSLIHWPLGHLDSGPFYLELFTIGAQPPVPTRLSRRTIKFSIPGEASEIFDDFLRRTSHFYANEREMVESAIAYMLWCEREHHLTGPSFASREARQKMWEEIIADYGKPKKAGSFFEHRVEEFVRQQRASHKGHKGHDV